MLKLLMPQLRMRKRKCCKNYIILSYLLYYCLLSISAYILISGSQLSNIGSLDPKKAKGKILVCLVSDITGIVLAEQEALLVGAVGLILANNEKRGNDIMAVVHLLPAAHINFTDGEYVYSYTKLNK